VADTDDTGTDAGQTPSGAEPQPQTPAAPPPANPPADSGGRTYTQQDLDAIAAKARREGESKAKAAEARIAELEAAEAERAKAEMTELERAKAEAEEARAAMAAAQSAAAASALAADRANIIAAEGQGLPPAYQAMVTGPDADAIRASLAAARAQHDAEQAALLARIAAMSPEQLAQLGDEGKALAERMAGQPVSIGAPSSATPPPAGNLRDDIARLDNLPPGQRENALVDALSRRR
jgi:hypothetical protein